jgi:mannose-6-phosphate isomerase
MPPFYPLRFKEILRNYGFGNRWIVSEFEKGPFPEGHRVAETWEVCDRPGESSIVANGPLAGTSLHELIERFGTDLLGKDVISRFGTRFPLLIKLLDVSHPLGEQAHHSDELAQARGLSDPGKTEAWYMLRTRPGATIRCGAKPNLTPSIALQAILDGASRELMREYAVQPGDAFLLLAGTMHYSAGGMIFYEIMQNSDVYIGLRPPDTALTQEERERQARLALEGISLDGSYEPHIEPVTLQEGANRRSLVLACRYFALERLDLSTSYIVPCDGQRFCVLTQIEGSCEVWAGGVSEMLHPGQSCLVPAACQDVRLNPLPGCVLLTAYVPDLESNVATPLRVAGISETAIARLQGR